MRQIYAAARTVLVAIDGLESHTEILSRALNLVSPTVSVANQSREVHELLDGDDVQSSLASFCQNRYWSRVWIVQEFAIGARIEFLIGSAAIEASRMQLVLNILESRRQPIQWSQADAIFDIRREWQMSRPLFLLDALNHLRFSKCGKRHDRVFGLLGLSTDAMKYVIEPDYTSTLDELNISITQLYIERSTLDIILVAPHRNLSTSFELPSWCPDFFRFDIYPPRQDIIDSVSGNRIWMATSNATSDISIHANTLSSLSLRVGSICSLGMAWSDPPNSGFPMVDTHWARRSKRSTIRTSIFNCIQFILQKRYVFSPNHRMASFERNSRSYSWLRVFLASHESLRESEIPQKSLARWVCGNRKFFAGGQYLQDHAASLWPPWTPGCLCVVNPNYLFGFDEGWPFGELEKAANQDMRLMCLDDNSYGIGWATNGARLHDEVFLVPGCSTPVILRRVTHNQYRLTGHAIIAKDQVMNGKLWEKTKIENLTEINII